MSSLDDDERTPRLSPGKVRSHALFLSVLSEPLNAEFYAWAGMILVLLFLSALMSSSEVAFFSLNQKDIHKLRQKKSVRNRRVITLLSGPRYLLSTILIANNLVNIAIILTASYLGLRWLDLGGNPVLSFIIQVVAITFLIVVLGEITPKIFAAQNNIRVAQAASLPISVLRMLLYPASYLLVSSTRIIENRFKAKRMDLGIDDLNHAIDATTSKETSPEEKKILKGLIKFGNISVRQIMRNRTDVVSVSCDVPFDRLLKTVRDNGYSRIPAHEENFDNIRGILYAKDLLEHAGKEADFNWHGLIRPAFFVPETMKIGDLLKDFQKRKVHLAVVVDEYGGSSGIVTMEDVLEEIVGDIRDEFDEEEVPFERPDDRSFIFDGKILLSDVSLILNLPAGFFEEAGGKADSLAGLMLELAGKMPGGKDQVFFKNLTLTAESVTRKRIDRVKITVPPKP